MRTFVWLTMVGCLVGLVWSDPASGVLVPAGSTVRVYGTTDDDCDGLIMKNTSSSNDNDCDGIVSGPGGWSFSVEQPDFILCDRTMDVTVTGEGAYRMLVKIGYTRPLEARKRGETIVFREREIRLLRKPRGVPEWRAVGARREKRYASAPRLADLRRRTIAVGTWGQDLTNNYVWAVVDHASQFAPGVVPEPVTLLTLLAGGTGLFWLRRRKA